MALTRSSRTTGELPASDRCELLERLPRGVSKDDPTTAVRRVRVTGEPIGESALTSDPSRGRWSHSCTTLYIPFAFIGSVEDIQGGAQNSNGSAARGWAIPLR
jgi:hypothetical protein